MHKPRILILYPDPTGLALLTSMLNSLGHPIEEAANDRAAVRLMERRGIDLVLAGVEPSDADALELLTYVRRKHREVPVILLFPRAHPDRAKDALRQGAMAVLKYPVPAVELRAAVLQALDQSGGRPATDPVGGSSGSTPASPADSKPAAVPLTASVGLPLTQAVRGGSPAGAVVVSGLNPSPGANPGPALAQATPTSAPVPAAGPAVLGMQRPEQFAREIGRPVPGFAPEALEMFRHHDWPGNVLELENTVERAVVHCRGARIEPRHLELNRHRPERPLAAGIVRLKEALEGLERRLIVEALEALNWNRQETARVLNINRTTLYKKMKKYRLLLEEPTWAN
jgi:DNA-binding NtrC family response regulator